MGRLDETVSEQFAKWENRGRGWQVWPYPVSPEPPFRQFRFQLPRPDPQTDDGRKPTLLSSFFTSIEKSLNPKPPVIREELDAEPEPEILEREPLVELRAILPSDLDASDEAFAAFLRQLSLCSEPIAFELLGTSNGINAQFVAHSGDVSLLHRQLNMYFPEAAFVSREGGLEQEWGSSDGDDALVVEFGLAREFMFPLASGKLDSFVGIVGALSELRPNEIALFQVLFQSAQNPWAESIVRSTTTNDHKPLFVNMPELTKAAEAKASQPLYAAVVRIGLRTSSQDRTLQIARDLAASLSSFADPQGNELIPLTNDDYPFEQHIDDMLRRQSRRSGMLLTSDELIGFVHLPSSAIRSSAFVRQAGRTRPAPGIARQATGLLLGENEHAGETSLVRITPEQRTRHVHIIGASGTGKSTLLFNLIRQDIEDGQAVAVLDPHGDLIDRICGAIPPERIDDVVLVDPSDPDYSVGFNILSAHSELEKNLLASDLVSVFHRLSTSWGDQLNSVLSNGILAFLESERRGTLADLRRFLIEPAFRSDFLKSVRDPEVVYYWQKSFPHLGGNKSIGSILTRLDTFLSKKPIRYMVSQPENKLDFAHIMDSGRIFLAKLPEGLLGRENSYLLGALLISKFQQTAMSRQAQQASARRDFWLYCDEFSNFITPSMAEILSGARKYRLGLTLAHHELQQLEEDRDVASAVMSHPFTRIVFRVGDDDSKKLAEGFSHFEAKDLRNLETGRAICRVERSDFDFNLTVPLPADVDAAGAEVRRREVITASKRKYGTAVRDVEMILEKSRAVPLAQPPSSKTPIQPIAPAPAPESPSSEPPNLVEAPKKDTVAEKKMPEPPAPAAVDVQARTEPEPPRDLGKGGGQHKAIQQRIKKAAEDIGFRSIIEHPIAGSKEGIDLYLKRAGQEIACEISISTTIDHEIGNAAKCLKAGITKVAIICLEDERLQKIAAAISGSLGPELSARVEYFMPDPFITHLKSLQQSEEPPAEKKIAGYKVKHSTPKLSPEEQKQKEDLAYRVLAETMRNKKK